jgi:flagellar motor switch protein FliN/FliY
MADESSQVSQDEIEQLLAQVKGAGPPPSGESAASLGQAEIDALLSAGTSTGSAVRSPATPARSPDDPQIAPGDVEFLLSQAQQALASVDAPASPTAAAGIAPFKLPEFGGAPATVECATLDLIRDVELDLKIELGRTQMHLEDVLKLRRGSVVPLDKLAGDPVDVFVNGRLIARGEVLVLNDNFCVRVAELVAAKTP